MKPIEKTYQLCPCQPTSNDNQVDKSLNQKISRKKDEFRYQSRTKWLQSSGKVVYLALLKDYCQTR